MSHSGHEAACLASADAEQGVFVDDEHLAVRRERDAERCVEPGGEWSHGCRNRATLPVPPRHAHGRHHCTIFVAEHRGLRDSRPATGGIGLVVGRTLPPQLYVESC